MGKDTPRYFIFRKGSYFWQPSSELRRAGWSALRLGKDRGAGVSKAIAINAEVDRWRAEGRPGRGVVTPPRAGSRRGDCNALFDLWQASREYPTNPRTKRDYDAKVAYLRKWLGPVPARAVTPRMCKERYLAMAERTPAQAAGTMRVARAGFGKVRFLVDPGHPLYIGAKDNPFAELDLKNTAGEGRLWTRDERDRFVATAFGNEAHYPSIGLAVAINWWLGQREGDILDLPPLALEGASLVIRQNKTARRVELPVGLLVELQPLWQRALELQRARGVSSLTHLLINEDSGQPWDEHQFRKAFRKVREAAELPDDLQFMHLRHTAIVMLEDAGCTIPEIAAISGHSLASITTILERYGRRTRRQAENAIAKRLAREASDREKKDGVG